MSTRPLRFANYLAPNMRPVYEMTAAWCGRRLGHPTELSTETDFQRVVRGEVDVAFLCGLPYADLRRRHPGALELLAAPVLSGERFERLPVYYSDVIVRADSPFESFDDLRGARWSYNDPDSQSGFNVVRWCLASWGRTQGFFGEVVEAGFHERSIDLVSNGDVDASAIDCQVLAVEMKRRPELRFRLRVIETLGPSPIQPIVASTRLPAQTRRELRDALLSLADDPWTRGHLAYGAMEGFAPVADADYDSIDEMTETALAAGMDRIR